MAVYEYKGIRPTLGREVFVAASASVIGDVHLGDESSVWFGTTIRGDVFPIRFGARTNLQDGSVVHVTGHATPFTSMVRTPIGAMPFNAMKFVDALKVPGPLIVKFVVSILASSERM